MVDGGGVTFMAYRIKHTSSFYHRVAEIKRAQVFKQVFWPVRRRAWAGIYAHAPAQRKQPCT